PDNGDRAVDILPVLREVYGALGDQKLRCFFASAPAVCVMVERNAEKTLRHTTARGGKKTVGWARTDAPYMADLLPRCRLSDGISYHHNAQSSSASSSQGLFEERAAERNSHL